MSYQYTTEEIAQALRNTFGAVYLAADALNCNPKTIYRRCEKVKWLGELLDDLRGHELDMTELKLRQAIQNGEPWAITLKLTTIGKKRGYTKDTNITANDGNSLVNVQVVLPDNGRGDAQ